MCAWSGALLLKSDQGLTSYSSFWVIVGRRTVNAQARTSPNDCVRKCTECYYYCLRTLRPEINKRTSSPLCLVISHLVSDRWVEETQHFYTLVLPLVLLSFLLLTCVTLRGTDFIHSQKIYLTPVRMAKVALLYYLIQWHSHVKRFSVEPKRRYFEECG